jgi:hypothetical protein
MDEFFFSLAIDSRKTLCIGPITRKEAASLSDSGLGDGSGLYLYFADSEARNPDISVIGKISSPESAALLANMMKAGKLDLRAF